MICPCPLIAPSGCMREDRVFRVRAYGLCTIRLPGRGERETTHTWQTIQDLLRPGSIRSIACFFQSILVTRAAKFCADFTALYIDDSRCQIRETGPPILGESSGEKKSRETLQDLELFQ